MEHCSIEPYVYTTCTSILVLVCGAAVLLKSYRPAKRGAEGVAMCWFCQLEQQNHVELDESWTCMHCGQYNGFAEDGGYDREIPEQFASCDRPIRYCRRGVEPPPTATPTTLLCSSCQLNLQLKVSQLASFQPTCEESFEDEACAFEKSVEKLYPLCLSCEEKTTNDINRRNHMIKVQMDSHTSYDKSHTIHHMIHTNGTKVKSTLTSKVAMATVWLWQMALKMLRKQYTPEPAPQSVVVVETPNTVPLCLDRLRIGEEVTPHTLQKSWFKSLADIQFHVDSSPDSSPASDDGCHHGMGTGKQPLIRPAKLKVQRFSVATATANIDLSSVSRNGWSLNSSWNRENGRVAINSSPFNISNNLSLTKQLTINSSNTDSPQERKKDDGNFIPKLPPAPPCHDGGSRRSKLWSVLVVVVTASLCCNVALIWVLGANMYNTSSLSTIT